MQPGKSDLRREPNEQQTNLRGQTPACDRHANQPASLTVPEREIPSFSGCYSLVVFQFQLILIEVIVFLRYPSAIPIQNATPK